MTFRPPEQSLDVVVAGSLERQRKLEVQVAELSSALANQTAPTAPAVPYVSLSISTAVSLASSTIGVAVWDGDVLANLAGMFTVGSPTKITISRPGFYVAGTVLRFAANATGERSVIVRLNGGFELAPTIYASAGAADATMAISFGGLELQAGDYLEAVGIQTSGFSLSFIPIRFWASFISPIG